VEVFQLVDESGTPIGSAPRARCHGDPRLIHLVVHLHVFDPSGRLYLQKRAAGKDTNPGLWDTSVGGHVHFAESVADALQREAREELAIDSAGASFLYGYFFRSAFESEYAQCWSLTWQGPVTPDPGEIEMVDVFTIGQIDALVGKKTLTPLFEREWPLLKAALAR
jgi:isopentenyldiphosphate isomerase